MNRSFNQSAMLVTMETDIGITGIGRRRLRAVPRRGPGTMSTFSGPALMEYN